MPTSNMNVNLIDQSTSTVPIGLTWMDTNSRFLKI